MKFMDNSLLTLAIIGCVNWGLIGLLDFNLVAMITGNMELISNIIYILVGLAGLFNIMLLFYHYEPAK